MRKFWVFVGFSAINLTLLNFRSKPVYFPDSFEYIGVAKQITALKAPDFALRAPTYPLYLTLFSGNFNLIGYANAAIGALGGLCLFWIVNQISKNKFANLVITMLAAADFEVISFQNTMLVESIAPALIIFSTASNLRLATGKNNYLKLILLSILADLALMYLKPNFLILPLCFKAYLLISAIFFKQKIRYLIWGVCINLVFVTALPIYNYFQSGNLQISKLEPIATFGRVLTLGYVENLPYYQDAPECVKTLIKFNLDNNRFNSPFDCKDALINQSVTNDPISLFAQANKYFLWKNKRSLVLAVPKLISDNFNVRREYYTKSDSILVGYTDVFYNFINDLKLPGFIVSLGIYLHWLIRRNIKAIPLGLIIITVFINVAIVSVLGYSEFARLRTPVDILMNLLVLLPFVILKPFTNFSRILPKAVFGVSSSGREI